MATITKELAAMIIHSRHDKKFAKKREMI